jgi:hypothetical protein
MSNGPQAATAAAFAAPVFETNSTLAMHPARETAISSPSVLLVGRNGSWGKTLLKFLAKFSCRTSFVAQDAVTSKSLSHGAFDLVLLDSTVSPAQRRQIASELAGSEASVFYTFPVETGCWWLPALRRGQDCHGAPAFRRNEFPAELERMLEARAEAWRML